MFRREAQWLLLLAVLVPLVATMVALVIPWLGRHACDSPPSTILVPWPLSAAAGA